ncbi:MAG: hypothetical protein ACOYUZ_02345 [Patescibacteria group bacterium]
MASASNQTQGLDKGAKIIYFALILILSWFLLITIFYFVFGINLLTALACLPIAILAAILIHRDDQRTSPYNVQGSTYNVQGGYFWLFALIAMVIDGFLFAQMIAARTSVAIVSPWDVLSWPHWILFFISSLFLILSLQFQARLRIFAALLHCAVMFWAAAIVYGFGFGFDPFIHQAAESAIIMHGKIAPLTILYSGQYAVAAALAILTGLPVHHVDIWLVPILTILMLLAVLFINKDQAWPRLTAVLLIPWPFLTFTIPYNFAVVLLLFAMLMIDFWEQKIFQKIILLLALFSMFLHPLIGIPFLTIAIAINLKNERIDKSLIVIIPGLMIGAFGIYALMNDGQFYPINGMMFVQNLKTLFANPFVNAHHPLLSFLYFIKHLWPWMFMVLGFWMIKKDNSRKNDILIYSASGVLIAAILINTLFYFQDIAMREQYEFALRLIKVMPIFFIPGVAMFIKRILEDRYDINPKNIVIAMIFAGIMIGSWYFNYEQNNDVAAFTAPAVSQDELDAVLKIDEMAAGEKYIVLSDQMTAAAALRKYGFDLKIKLNQETANAYAIPTGGYLYQQYQFLFQRPDLSKKIFDQIFESTDADLIFVTIKNSWDPQMVLTNELQKISNESSHERVIKIFKIRKNPDFML